MGGCFSGQKGLESENAPVPAPASPKAAEAEPTTAPPTTENIESLKEEPLVDVSETKEEELKKDDEVVPKVGEAEAEAEAKPAQVPDAAPEEPKVAEVRSEDKTSAAPAAL